MESTWNFPVSNKFKNKEDLAVDDLELLSIRSYPSSPSQISSSAQRYAAVGFLTQSQTLPDLSSSRLHSVEYQTNCDFHSYHTSHAPSPNFGSNISIPHGRRHSHQILSSNFLDIQGVYLSSSPPQGFQSYSYMYWL